MDIELKHLTEQHLGEILVLADKLHAQDIAEAGDEITADYLSRQIQNPDRLELISLIDGLPDGAKRELVALIYRGRDEQGSWAELLNRAATHGQGTGTYLADRIDLAKNLRDGLSKLSTN